MDNLYIVEPAENIQCEGDSLACKNLVTRIEYGRPNLTWKDGNAIIQYTCTGMFCDEHKELSS